MIAATRIVSASSTGRMICPFTSNAPVNLSSFHGPRDVRERDPTNTTFTLGNSHSCVRGSGNSSLMQQPQASRDDGVGESEGLVSLHDVIVLLGGADSVRTANQDGRDASAPAIQVQK